MLSGKCAEIIIYGNCLYTTDTIDKYWSMFLKSSSVTGGGQLMVLYDDQYLFLAVDYL